MSSAFLGEKQILILETLASFTLVSVDVLAIIELLKLSPAVCVKECLKKRSAVKHLCPVMT